MFTRIKIMQCIRLQLKRSLQNGSICDSVYRFSVYVQYTEQLFDANTEKTVDRYHEHEILAVERKTLQLE